MTKDTKQKIKELLDTFDGSENEKSLRILTEFKLTNPVAAAEVCSHLVGEILDRELLVKIIEEALGSYEPGMCLNNWGRFFREVDQNLVSQAIRAPNGIEHLSLLFSFSQTISEQLFSSPNHLKYLFSPNLFSINPTKPSPSKEDLCPLIEY